MLTLEFWPSFPHAKENTVIFLVQYLRGEEKGIATSFQLSMELMSIFIASCVCALVPIFHLLHSFATFIKISFSSFFCVFVKFFQWYDHVLWKRMLCLWICYSSQFVHLCFFASFLKISCPSSSFKSQFSFFSNHFYKKKVPFQHIGYKLEGPSAI